MDLITTKILVAILFGSLRFIFGILPLKIYAILQRWEKQETKAAFINEKRHHQVQCALAMCQSFGGGVLFATCLLHMMPEVHDSVEELKKYTQLETGYPFSQLIVCLGFLLIYFVEEASHWLISKVPEDPLVCSRKSSTTHSNKISPKNEESVQNDTNIFTIVSAIQEKEISDKASINSMADIENQENLKNLEENEKVSEIIEEQEVVNEIIEEKVKTKQHVFRGIVVILALCLHAVLEGLAIGLQNSMSNIWYLFTAVSIHSATIMFYVGFELLLARTKNFTIFIHIIVLSVASPLGIMLGLLITIKYSMNTKAKSAAVVILEGLSAGTVLYITFFEVLNREKERRIFRMRRAVCIVSGFVLMALLQCVDVNSK